jgi:hypothetical protein
MPPKAIAEGKATASAGAQTAKTYAPDAVNAAGEKTDNIKGQAEIGRIQPVVATLR